MTNPEFAHPEIVRHISAGLDDLTDEQVQRVLESWNRVREGDPVGTVRRDPQSGAVAHRVDHEGVHLWRVSAPDGSQHNDMQPSLPWPELTESG
jgi:hypothetical protein